MTAKQVAPGPARRSSWGFALGISFCVLTALLLAISAAIYSRWLMAAPRGAAVSQSDNPSTADTKEMVVEVVDLHAQGLLKARLLRQAGSDYLRTSDLVWIKLDPSTPVTMGSRRDIRAGTILDVTAAPKSAPGEWDAVGLAVLTGYVRVSGGS